MEKVLRVQHHFLLAHGFITCRPWLPWSIPVGFLVVFQIASEILKALVGFYNVIPMCWESLIILSTGMALLTLPLYRRPHIPVWCLYCVMIYSVMMIKHVAFSVLRCMHPCISTPLGVINVGCVALILWQWFQYVSDPTQTPRKLRRWIWSSVTQVLPVVLVPQMMLVLVVM
jgi:hypothetical protein